jgi:AmmeMemoRadiSam system protein B/AmmeMemoRadiSam system protein A
MRVREPSVAGQFYPGDAEGLKRKIESLLEDPKIEKKEGEIYGIVVPHAGYNFSGLTAAHAFRQLQGEQYDTVVIMGPSHQFPFKGAAVYPAGYFRTPLGDVEIDSAFADALTANSEHVIKGEDPHVGEHSLEVEIPFLQTVLEGFKIVPICMGEQSFESCEALANSVVKTIREFPEQRILMVASSDFYHGYDYEDCKTSLSESVFLISQYNATDFYHAFQEKGSACGGGCITVCMLAGQKLGARKAVLLYSTNSADVVGVTSGYVVGYASFMLTNPESLSEDDKKMLLKIAHDSITAVVTGEPFKASKSSASSVLAQKRGCFVTIKKQGVLRGCIGYVLPVKSLYRAVSDMAAESATGDPRFPRVAAEELAEIKIEISALTPLKRVESINEIQVGRDGLYIKKDNYSGLLLPQVAVEEGWDRMKFLEQTCWKAGLPNDAWKNAEVYSFQAEIFGDES